MDRPLLFLILALVAVGVFLYLRRQDDEANTPSTGGGVPFDTDATARIKELDAAITDLTRRFAEFDTLSNVLSRDAVAGITEILGEIVQVRAELQSMDVDSAESGTRKAVVSRLDKFSRTVETVVRAAKVDQARVSLQPTEAAGPVLFSPMFTAAPNVGERAVEFSPMGSETTKPVFGYPNVNETLAPADRVRPEEGVTGRERFPGVKVAKVRRREPWRGSRRGNGRRRKCCNAVTSRKRALRRRATRRRRPPCTRSTLTSRLSRPK